jgi:hypothetical protein
MTSANRDPTTDRKRYLFIDSIIQFQSDLCSIEIILEKNLRRTTPSISEAASLERRSLVVLTLGRFIAALWPTNRPIGWISKVLVMIICVDLEHSELLFKKLHEEEDAEWAGAKRLLPHDLLKRGALSRSLASTTNIHPPRLHPASPTFNIFAFEQSIRF